MAQPVDDDTVRAVGARQRGVLARRTARHKVRVAKRAGLALNKKWADQFVKAGYKYVFTEIPIQGWEQVRSGGFPGKSTRPMQWRATKWVPEGDVVFGNSLDDLSWFDSKARPTTGLTPSQRMSYPKINANGGVIAWEKADLPINEVDGKPVDLRGRKIRPNRGHIAYAVDLSAVASGQQDLASVLDKRRGQIIPGPAPVAYLDLEDSRLVTDRGLSPKKPQGSPPIPAARVVSSAGHASGIVGGLRSGLKTRSLVLGLKAWRAVRLVGNVFVVCFVPLKALDIVLEVAMAVWDREREKKERQEQEKQRTLEAVFKQGAATIEKGMRAIVGSAATVQSFMDAWEKSPRHPGFHYARLRAVVQVESYRGIVSARVEQIDSLTTYRIVSLDVKPTSGYHDFEIAELGEEKEVEKSDKEKVALMQKGHDNPDLFRKTVRNRSLGYTIVPPLHTPFDVVVTKINNLFVDMTNVITGVGGTGNLWLEDFKGFNYTKDWKDQFDLEPQFNAPLDASVCEFCLRYLFASAKVLSRHPLEQQDLEGNLEDPRKGYMRRFNLLATRVDHDRAPYTKNFSDFVRQVGRLVKSGRADADVAAAVEELQSGARSIWNDLRRIEHDIKHLEYYYLGPNYKPAR